MSEWSAMTRLWCCHGEGHSNRCAVVVQGSSGIGDLNQRGTESTEEHRRGNGSCKNDWDLHENEVVEMGLGAVFGICYS